MPCIKIIVDLKCHYCQNDIIKFGHIGDKKRYRCKNCNKTQLNEYLNHGCSAGVDAAIAAHIKEGCGVRSISRLLSISATTVLSRIQKIANSISRPAIATDKMYEVDELKTYVKKKINNYWVICALERDSKRVVDFKVGKRTKKNLKRVTDTLLLAKCIQIYTDGLDIYKYIVPAEKHKVERYGTNHIERKNLSLRTHLKRLNRRTICFSKNLSMLEACLKIYFWYAVPPG